MRLLIILLVGVGGMLVGACGGDDDNTSTPTAVPSVTEKPTPGAGPASGLPFVVVVRLKDYEVIPNPDAAPTGPYEFQISNTGPSTHEFVVVKTNLAADQLPTDADGAVAEGGELEAIGEVEDVEVGTPQKLTSTLEAGHYVFFCNIVEQGGGGTIAHYTQGMRQDFTVQ